MSPSGIFCRCVPVVFFLLISLQAASAWDVQNLVIKPGEGTISPRTPVTVTYIVHFDSWMTGLTFPAASTLDMYTDLENAQWDITITDYERDPPETSPLVEKKGPQVRIDGWTLSYAQRQLDLNVRVQGSAPDVDRTQEKIMIRVQERDSAGQPLASAGTARKFTVSVATPAPSLTTPPPVQTPAGIATVETMPQIPGTPARKQTYTPGPEPLLVCGMLAGVLIGIAVRRGK